MLFKRISLFRRARRLQPVRKITCTPESVSTTPLISPTARANVASSNGFCICPRPNSPKSPPRWSSNRRASSSVIRRRVSRRPPLVVPPASPSARSRTLPLEQSLTRVATSSNAHRPLATCSLCANNSSIAALFVRRRVMSPLASSLLVRFRDSRCLMRTCDARARARSPIARASSSRCDDA